MDPVNRRGRIERQVKKITMPSHGRVVNVTTMGSGPWGHRPRDRKKWKCDGDLNLSLTYPRPGIASLLLHFIDLRYNSGCVPCRDPN